ncbi:hypothetical protein [Planctobacterium marinum]|uniref:hypothetical protein n=1 Tax=Planctobacterium marinum TaxID=1631968 RepID=UPI001E514F87|nr:hypothetical protein [Planctobacterium marinum]MCC2607760.1 hypothetical protein [Planctobacterium marinum]
MMKKQRQGIVLRVCLFCCALFYGAANAGLVAFFDVKDARDGCPTGWQELSEAKGRMLRGTTNGDEVGRVNGQPMPDKTPPKHDHEITLGVTLDYEPVVANSGGNPNLTHSGIKRTVTGRTSSSDGNMPYMQMLLCEYVGVDQDGERIKEPLHDYFPREMVNFFNDRSCPDNWEKYDKLHHRFIVPIPADAKADEYNLQVGDWPGNQITHDHHVYVSDAKSDNVVHLPVIDHSVVLAKSFLFFKQNTGFGKATFKDQFFRTEASSPDAVPYINLMVCQKTAGRARTSRLPLDLFSFIAAEDCPNKWGRSPHSNGRFLVGLPAGDTALSGTSFGGEPLNSKEIRTHNHKIRMDITLPSNYIGGASGSGASGYAQSGTYTMDGEAVPTISTYPYVQMRNCTVTQAARDASR